jgi:hypothetical protein
MVATVVYSLQTLESQFQANSNTSGDQLAPDVLGLSNGGYVVAYNNGNINLGFICLRFDRRREDPFYRDYGRRGRTDIGADEQR